MPLMFNKLSIAGSLIGGIPETQVVIVILIMMRKTRSMMTILIRILMMIVWF